MIFDLESDALEIEDVTKIHCVSYSPSADLNDVRTIYDKEDIVNLFNKVAWVAGHNIVRYDLRVLKKIYGIDYKGVIYDTLPMSWVFDDGRQSFGLESYGEDFNVPKPVITDWSEQPVEVYAHRCEEDVKINIKLWNKLSRKAKLIYGKDKETLSLFLRYLTFKMDCAAEQEVVGWRLDVKKCEDALFKIQDLIGPKHEELKSVLPKVRKYKEKVRPNITHKKDGSISVAYQRWLDLLDFHGLPHDYVGGVKVLSAEEEPKPNSPNQIKDWLFSLGWQPCTFDYKKEASGKERRVPLIKKHGQLTPSVEKLAEEHEEVRVLSDLSVLQHREGVLQGFLDSVDDNGYLKAEIAGLTNTLRFKHMKPIVNLPGVDKPWGKEIRGCLVAPDDQHILCGSDMVSLEATTKAHYLYDYDPDFATEMTKEDFDEHLDLGVSAGLVSKDEMDFYIWFEKEYGG